MAVEGTTSKPSSSSTSLSNGTANAKDVQSQPTGAAIKSPATLKEGKENEYEVTVTVDIGEHFLVQRSDNTWREYSVATFVCICPCLCVSPYWPLASGLWPR